MVEFLAFFKEYYHLILLFLILVVLVLEIIISKINIKNPSILSAIDKVVPEFILAAEERFSDGKAKLNYVVLNTEDYLRSLFDIKNVHQYEKYIISLIEKILSCPQKKGDFTNGK